MSETIDLILDTTSGRALNALNNRYEIDLTNTPVEVKGEECYVSVLSSSVWNIFNNIDTHNNKILYTRAGSAHIDAEILLTPGSYEVIDLINAVYYEVDKLEGKLNDGNYIRNFKMGTNSATGKFIFQRVQDGTLAGDVTLKFNDNGPSLILGGDQILLEDNVFDVLYMDDRSKLNAINSILFHCDLVDDGANINGVTDYTVCNHRFQARPGSQSNQEYMNPRKHKASKLLGRQYNKAIFWITDQNGDDILNHEPFSIELRISVK